MSQWRVLFDFITTHRDLLVGRAREKLQKRVAPRPADHELEGVPQLLGQLAIRLQGAATTTGDDAAVHGRALLAAGFTIGQVVHDYGGVCEAILDVARELGLALTATETQALNKSLDHAIAEAVTAYSSQRERQLEGQHVEQIGFLAHELRNLMNTATLAFDAVRSGSVGVAGTTSRLVASSMLAMSQLVTRTLAEVRLQAGPPREEQIPIARLLEEIEIGATLEARTREVTLSFEPAALDMTASGDAQIVASIVTNLVQNACKFTRKSGKVWLSTRVLPDRIAIDVADECGGLPPGKIEELFDPFQQRGENRSGLGLGLAISRRGAQAIGAELSARDIPGTGCVFSVALRRSA